MAGKDIDAEEFANMCRQAFRVTEQTVMLRPSEERYPYLMGAGAAIKLMAFDAALYFTRLDPEFDRKKFFRECVMEG